MANWRPVEGWHGFYEVSDEGQVCSVVRLTTRRDGTVQTWPRRFMAATRNSKGYLVVRLSDDAHGRRAQRPIHRLVAEAFIPNPDRKPEVNHIDGVKTHNPVSNLEWVTKRENRQHAWRNGLRRTVPFLPEPPS